MPKYTQRDINSIVDFYNMNFGNGQGYETNGPFYGIDWLSQDYIEHMRQLEQQYQSIDWLPLAVPKIEIDNLEEFMHFWDQESVPSTRLSSDIAEPWSKEDHPLGTESSWYKPRFRDLALYEDSKFTNTAHSIWRSKLFEGKNRMVDRLVEQVFEYYPIDKTMPPFRIFIWESLDDIYPHKDQSAHWKCLTDFRTMLHDENTKPTLYVVNTETKHLDGVMEKHYTAASTTVKESYYL
jgi:hypothetical protein